MIGNKTNVDEKNNDIDLCGSEYSDRNFYNICECSGVLVQGESRNGEIRDMDFMLEFCNLFEELFPNRNMR